MNVVDSSGWLEYFTGGRLAKCYAPYIEKRSELLVPTLVLYEVYRWIKKHDSEEVAVKYVAQMSQSKIIDLHDSLALLAADLSLEHHLAMADSIVYASALSHHAKLVTSDSDFKKLEGIIYFPKS